MEPVPKPINISSATSNGDRHKVPKQASCEVKVCLPVPPVTAHRHQVREQTSSEVEACLLAFPGTDWNKVPGEAPGAAQVGVVMFPAIKCCTKNAVSGVRPEEEPQGSIWFLT